MEIHLGPGKHADLIPSALFKRGIILVWLDCKQAFGPAQTCAYRLSLGLSVQGLNTEEVGFNLR